MGSSYLRAAAVNQYNVILLAGSVSFSAALASWAPLISGLMGEAVWLLTGPRLSAFRRRTDARKQREQSARALGTLGAEYSVQVQALQVDLDEVERSCATRAEFSSDRRAEVSERLHLCFQAFLEVCQTHQRLRRVAGQTALVELQSELASLHRALASETDLGVRASLRRALTVAERRIKQLEVNDAACRSLELAAQTLLKSVAYIKEHAAGVGTPMDVCAEIDAAVAQLGRAAALQADRDNELAANPPSMPPSALN